ncbi:MAG: hypothetical protein ACLFOY_01895 [Desulfatibacillaceae bacterium]
MGSAFDILSAVNPPRAVFLDYPLGHTAGKPGEPELQREILMAALSAFEAMAEPGSIQALPFKWDAEDSWKDSWTGGDMRLERLDTPQYQDEEDRRRAEEDDTALLPPRV